MPLDNTWRLLSEFAVDDAAVIIAGGDPSYLEYDRLKALWNRHKIENTSRVQRQFGGPFGTPQSSAAPPTSYEDREPKNQETTLLIQKLKEAEKRKKEEVLAMAKFKPAFAGLTGAVLSGEIIANIAFGSTLPAFRDVTFQEASKRLFDTLKSVREEAASEPISVFGQEFSGENNGINWSRTTVKKEVISVWLKSLGFGGTFFTEGDSTEDFSDANNPKYSAELDCAVAAWRAVSTADDIGQSPKKMLAHWYNVNAAKFALLDDVGLPMGKAGERIVTLVNWAKGGGAPKTPG